MADLHWQYQTAGDLDQSLAQRLRNFPRQPDMLMYGLRSLSAPFIRGWLRAHYHRLQIDGRENLPADGSFVMVCNHVSHLDALCLLSALPRKKLHHAFPVAAQDYFFVNLRRTAAAAIFVNAIPFSRKASLRQSMDMCRQLLAIPGNIMILFPEGTRSTTGELGEFRPGIGSLAAGLEVPVVPCALHGAFTALPKGAWLPRPAKLRLTIGKPRRYHKMDHDREAIHQVCDELQQAVKELLCS